MDHKHGYLYTGFAAYSGETDQWFRKKRPLDPNNKTGQYIVHQVDGLVCWACLCHRHSAWSWSWSRRMACAENRSNVDGPRMCLPSWSASRSLPWNPPSAWNWPWSRRRSCAATRHLLMSGYGWCALRALQPNTGEKRWRRNGWQTVERRLINHRFTGNTYWY